MPTFTDDRGVLPDEVPLGVTLDRVCVGCGTAYQWTSREGWQWPTSYCTRSCKRKSAATRLVNLDDVDETPEGMRLLICAYCGEPFGWTPRAEADGILSPPIYCKPTHGTAARLARRKLRRAQADAEKAARRAAHEAAVQAKRERQAQRAAREGRIEEANRLRREIAAQQREATQPPAEPDQTQLAKAERIAAASAAARELLLPGCRCAVCGKVASLDKEEAKRARRRIADIAGNHNEVRYYQCPGSGFWHWTSQV